MNIYRGIKDIMPSKINHFIVDNDGFYGQGCYHTRIQKTAEWYAYKNCHRFGIVISYEVDDNLPILTLIEDIHFKLDHTCDDMVELTPEGRSILNSNENKVKIKEFSDLARQQGFYILDIFIKEYNWNIDKSYDSVIILLYDIDLKIEKYTYKDLYDNHIEFENEKELEKKIRKDMKYYQTDE